jgi:transcriptional regulator with XRE-family HTH domain
MFLQETKGVFIMNIGIRIQTLLDEKKMSRREFARRLDINYSTATGYLKDRRLPDCETLFKMSVLLNTSTDYLIGRTTIRHHRDLYYTEKEGILISNFRTLSPDMQQVLINISSCLRFTPHKERTFWKQD